MRVAESSRAGWKICIVAILLFCAIGLCVQAVAANDEVTLYLQWYHQFQFAGYYAALEQGYYGEEGLDVAIVEGGPGIENYEAVLSAPGRYGTAHAAGLLVQRSEGKALVVLASIFQHSPNAIIARADRGIRSPHDLRVGRTVIWPGGHVELSAMLLNEGVDPTPFLLEASGDCLQDLLDGKVDAIGGYVTNEALSIQEAGVPIVVISPINYGVDFYGDVLMTSEMETKEHASRARSFRSASIRGWEYAMEHPEEVVDLILSKYGGKGSRAHLLSESEAVKELVMDPLIEIGHTNPGRWQRMADTLAVLDDLNAQIQTEDFLLNPEPETDLTRLYTGLAVAASLAFAVGLLALVLLRFNRRLRLEVAERRSAEQELARLRRQNELILSSAGEGIYGLDLTGTTTFVNPEAARLIGWEPSELIGLNQHSVLHHTRADGTRYPADECPIYAAFKDGSVHHVDSEVFWRKDGTCFPVDYISAPIRNEAGEIEGAVVSFRDITKRRAAEEALRMSEARFKTLYELAPFMIHGFDEEGRCILWNDECEKVLGWTMEEISASDDPLSLFYPDPEVRAAVMKTVTSEPDGDFHEWNPVTKDGRELVTLWSNTRPPDGTVFNIGQDITEIRQVETDRRATEVQMQQTQKLESLGVMAGGIAHDFNNLLHIILGHADSVLEAMPAHGNGRGSLQEIVSAARRGAGLTDQMLAYTGKGALAVENIDLTGLVQEMAHLLDVSHSKKAVVNYDLDRRLPAIEVDPSQLRQVVMNLITNASEAIGDEAGLVTVTTGVTEKRCDFLSTAYFEEKLPGGRYVYLKVSDTGCGMSEETQRRIFEPFFTTKFSGRGLGMAAVLGIVRAHRGTLEIESELGRGTTITVLLPALDEPAAALELETQIESGLSAEGTILVVDDEEAVLHLMQLLLEARGFTVLSAADGREAVELYREHVDEIVCVLLDLTMPVMDGIETYAELRRIREDVRVILLSGYSEREVHERLGNCDVVGFLKKPCESHVLIEKIYKVLEVDAHT